MKYISDVILRMVCGALPLLGLVLTGCAAVTQNQSAQLLPGIPVAEVNRKLQWVAARANFTFNSRGKDYSARIRPANWC